MITPCELAAHAVYSGQQAADLEVAKVLLPELHFFLNALQLIWRKAGADAVVGLAGTLVGRGVEEEVVGHAIAVHGLLDLLPCLLCLLQPTQRLHNRQALSHSAMHCFV